MLRHLSRRVGLRADADFDFGMVMHLIGEVRKSVSSFTVIFLP